MNIIRKSVINLIIIFTTLAQSAEYYVDNASGNDNNTGTIGNPWKTIGKANLTLQPGDIVYIRGGIYNVSVTAIDPKNTGTLGNPITYSNYSNEEVIFNYVGKSTNDYAVNLNSDYGIVRSYIKIHGINFINFNRHMWILKGDHNEISYCSFTGVTANVADLNWRGSTIYRNARYNWVHDCIFGDYGGSLNDGDDYGTVFELGNEKASDDNTSFNLVEDNHMYHGGHHVMGIHGHQNIVRNNYFRNDTFALYNGDHYGNRVLYSANTCGSSNNDGRNLIEGNRIAYGSKTSDTDVGGTGYTLALKYNIFRKNVVYQGYVHGAFFKSYDAPAANNYFYNNVYWHNGHDESQTGKGSWSWEWTHAIVVYEVDIDIKDNIFKNNIFYDNRNYWGDEYPIIAFYPQRDLPDNQILNNNWMEEGNPYFTDISGDPDPDSIETQFDFNLQPNSPCIDLGTFLTTIISEDGSGTSFIVADAGYFCDGWGIGDSIPTSEITGDTIQLSGQNQTAVIKNVNYNTNILIIDTPLTWTKGQGISLSYKGSAPDIGAHETDTKNSSKLSSPQNLRIKKKN